MNIMEAAVLDAWLLGHSTESLLAAEAKPDTRTPTQWLRVIRVRSPLVEAPRLLIVDVLRLPGALNILRYGGGAIPFEYLQQVTGPMRGPTLRGRFSGAGFPMYSAGPGDRPAACTESTGEASAQGAEQE